jgi:hypothetical protein
VGGYVFDPLAVDEDAPSVFERVKIFGTCAHRQFSPARLVSASRAIVALEKTIGKAPGAVR